MRIATFDAKRIRQRAERSATGTDSVLRRWRSHKYKRPANDRLFVKRTLGSLVEEMFEDLFVRRDEVKDELKTASGARRAQLEETLSALTQALADPDAPSVLKGDFVP